MCHQAGIIRNNYYKPRVGRFVGHYKDGFEIRPIMPRRPMGAPPAGRRGRENTVKTGMVMTADDFRDLALSLPEAVESAHMGHPDFRVGGKIFATLGVPDKDWGMVKLTPEQQQQLVREEPEIFMPVKGGWGRRGATNVRLQKARKQPLLEALSTAWRNTAPKKLVERLDFE